MNYDEVELLAPAGKWDVLEKVVEAGADAVYLGGKSLNMRMLKADFNFSHEELREAAIYLHEKEKKLYITINNLYFNAEINDVKEYLSFLQEINVDALIIQDMGVAQLCEELDLNVPMHASVQMGISNSAAVRFLEQRGFTRAILSKNLSLEEIEAIHRDSGLMIEFFAHGDLCISHTGQCYMSSLLRGECGNRGRCIKPCRWKYKLQGGAQNIGGPAYLLAHNDLCLYPHLVDLLNAGVRSFKIEGRMRPSEYLAPLVEKYRLALDRIIKEQSNYKLEDNELQELYNKRIRDFTSGNLYSRPDLNSIGTAGEREPFFHSSAFKLASLQPDDYKETEQTAASADNKTYLTVKVGNLESFEQIKDTGVDSVILGYEYFRRDKSGWTVENITEALRMTGTSNIKIFLETPRIITQSDLKIVGQMANLGEAGGFDGYIANDYGSMEILKKTGLPVYGGYGLNISNSKAIEFLKGNGINHLTASLELCWNELKSLPASGSEMELIVHGPVCGIVTDFCLPQAFSEEEGGECSAACLSSDYCLVDEEEQKFRIRTDLQCRNYIYNPYELCLFPYLPVLASAGYKHMRIEGQFYPADLLKQVVEIYLQACDDLTKGGWGQKQVYLKLIELFPQGLTAAPVFLDKA